MGDESGKLAVFAGDRSEEFAARMAGESYAAGGIRTTVAATRAATDEQLTAHVAHLVAETVGDARKQWAEVFSRDRADLGPAHARRQAIDAIDRYGPASRSRPAGGSPTFERRPPAAERDGIRL